MTSRPTTPSATLPQSQRDWRFKDTAYPSEWVESYRPGRLHPVNLYDTFKDGQYLVIRKLGYGSFSTVWLARDTLNSRYVALKVMDAKATLQSSTELSIAERINQRRPHDPLSQHILTDLDSFQHLGPNGTHLCIVSEPMGPPVASLCDEHAPWKESQDDDQDPENMAKRVPVASLSEEPTSWIEWHGDYRYPKNLAKRILKHALLGLVFLHQNGIVHADIQQGNLLSTISNIDQLSEDDLRQNISGVGRNSRPEAVQRRDGLEDRWAPRYLYLGQSLVKYIKPDEEMAFKISDLGGAFWAHEPPKSTITPLGLRAPELILGGETLDSSIDIWSLGCLIFELLTGHECFSAVVLFEVERETVDDEHLLQMNDLLQPLPDTWLEKTWPRAKKYFGPGRERIGPCDDKGEPYIDDPLEVRFREQKPDDIDDAEAEVITSLIRCILKYEPKQRPTAQALLKHPWFQD